MENFNELSYESFKREVCSRCEVLYDLRRRETLLTTILDKYPTEAEESSELELKYPLGTEGVREKFKQGCTYVSKCDDVIELIDKIDLLEQSTSKLMYYMMINNNEKEVYYISADIDPYYSVLSNRIIRCNRTKESVIKDIYDTKKLMSGFKKDE